MTTTTTTTTDHPLPATAAAIERGIAEGLHPGAQLCVAHRGSVVADLAFGERRPGEPMTRDTLLRWLSTGKPVAAVAVAQLWEQGKLDLDDPVATHVPEFAAHGKEAITLRHLLTHTGGFRWANLHAGLTWDEAVARVSDARVEPRWVVGRTAGYHAFSSWVVLGEVVRRLTDTPYEEYVRESIFLPLGMSDCWFAMAPDTYAWYGPRIGPLFDTESGSPQPSKFDLEAKPWECSPGSSGRGPAHQLVRFYQMMLNRGRSPMGTRVLGPQTVEALTARHRVGMHDLTFKHVVDWGLGFIVNSAHYGAETVPYGFGPHASPRTFGHGGRGSSVAFADPEQDLAVALIFNGSPGEAAHDRRLREVTARIYEDLRLA